MIQVVQRVKETALFKWANGRPQNVPKRWVTALATIVLLMTPTVTAVSLYRLWNTREADKCEQRVATRDDTRGVWFAVINYLSESGADATFVVGLTAQVNNAYPSITVEECLTGTA